MYTSVEGRLVRHPYVKPKVSYSTIELDGEAIEVVAFAAEEPAYKVLSEAKKDDKLTVLGIKQKDPRDPNVIQILARDIRPAHTHEPPSFREYWNDKLQDSDSYYQHETIQALKQARDENWNPDKKDVLPDAI